MYCLTYSRAGRYEVDPRETVVVVKGLHGRFLACCAGNTDREIVLPRRSLARVRVSPVASLPTRIPSAVDRSPPGQHPLLEEPVPRGDRSCCLVVYLLP